MSILTIAFCRTTPNEFCNVVVIIAYVVILFEITLWWIFISLLGIIIVNHRH